MAGKTISMHQIRRIIELLLKNHSLRTVGRLTGIARNTIASYKSVLDESKIPLQELLLLQDEELNRVPLTESIILPISWQAGNTVRSLSDHEFRSLPIILLSMCLIPLFRFHRLSGTCNILMTKIPPEGWFPP